MVLANPPYSIKKWNREAWQSDPWGRNFLGTPPQGRADYAFFQHILKSLDPKTGRCAILFPHGVLFRNEEAEMRRKLVESDLLECVLGLGPNLFYNSPMEACVVICRTQKPADRAREGPVHRRRARGRAGARAELPEARAPGADRQGLPGFADEPGFAKVATIEEVLEKDGNLSIPRYVQTDRERREQRRRPATSRRRGPRSTPAGASSGSRWTRWWTCSTASSPRRRPMPESASRSGWTRVAFGDVVRLVKDRVDDPRRHGVERYVGLEHLDPESLDDSTLGQHRGREPTFTTALPAGTVLFGKRRAYQRKVAVADFDGVCSATRYRPSSRRPDSRCLPEFLPFFMQSDALHGARESRCRRARSRRRSTGRALQGTSSPCRRWRSSGGLRSAVVARVELQRCHRLRCEQSARLIARASAAQVFAATMAMSATLESRSSCSCVIGRWSSSGTAD